MFDTAHYELDDGCNWELVFTTWNTFDAANEFVIANVDVCGAHHIDPIKYIEPEHETTPR